MRREGDRSRHARFDLADAHDGGAGAEVGRLGLYHRPVRARRRADGAPVRVATVAGWRKGEAGQAIASLPLDGRRGADGRRFGRRAPTPAPGPPTIAAGVRRAGGLPPRPHRRSVRARRTRADAAAHRGWKRRALLARGVARGSFVAVARDPADRRSRARGAQGRRGVPAGRRRRPRRAARADAGDRIRTQCDRRTTRSRRRLSRPGLDVLCPAREVGTDRRRGRRLPRSRRPQRDPAGRHVGIAEVAEVVVVPHGGGRAARILQHRFTCAIGTVGRRRAAPNPGATTSTRWGAAQRAGCAPIPKATAISPLRSPPDARSASRRCSSRRRCSRRSRAACDAFSGCRTVLFGGEAVDAVARGAPVGSKPPSRRARLGSTEHDDVRDRHEVRGCRTARRRCPGRAIAERRGRRAACGRENLSAPGEPGEIVIGGAR